MRALEMRLAQEGDPQALTSERSSEPRQPAGLFDIMALRPGPRGNAQSRENSL